MLTYVERPANSRDPAGGDGDVPAMLRKSENYASADGLQVRRIGGHNNTDVCAQPD